jgi:integrase
MATVRKREWVTRKGEGREAWVVSYSDRDGKRRIETFPRRRDAVTAKTKIESDLQRGLHVPASVSKTVAEAAKVWLNSAEADGVERSTLNQYRSHAELHIKPLIGNLKLVDLTPSNLAQFRDMLRSPSRSDGRGPCSPALTAKVLTSLSSILAEAMARGDVARNALREGSSPSQKRHRHAQRRHRRHVEVGVDIPTKAEAHAILEATKGSRYRALVATAIHTGLRSSELRGLTWDDVDIERETIVVRQRADYTGKIGAPKSHAAKREVPLAPIVVNVLREHRLACPKGPLNLVFPNGTGRPEAHSSILYRGLGPIEAKAGLSDEGSPKYGLHAFRHFACSMFIELGFAPKEVQEIMGHSSIVMTFDVYGHLFPKPEERRQRMQRLQVVGA